MSSTVLQGVYKVWVEGWCQHTDW